MNDKMLELVKALKEECDNTNCSKCSINTICSEEFCTIPTDWDLPEEEQEQEEETSIVVTKRLEALLKFINRLTIEINSCKNCPMIEKCNHPKTSCKCNLLAWLQDQPII